jgi:hypothetical protein
MSRFFYELDVKISRFTIRHASVGLFEGPATAHRVHTVVRLFHCTSHSKYVQGRGGMAIGILNRKSTVLWVTVSLSGRLVLYPAKKPAVSLG